MKILRYLPWRRHPAGEPHNPLLLKSPVTMGIFDFFSGPMTQEKFSQIVLSELRKLDPASQYVWKSIE